MENLGGVLILYALLVLINVAISGSLYFIHRSKISGWLFLLWSCSFAVWVVQGAVASRSGLPKVLAFSITGVGDFILARILAHLGGFDLPNKRIVAVAGAGLAGTLLLHVAGADSHWMALPLTFAVAYPALHAGCVALFRHRDNLTFSSKGMAATAICMGLLNLGYAQAYDQPTLAARGFLAGVLIVFALSSFAPAAAIERAEKERAETEAENRYRASLTNSAKLAALGEMAGGVAHEINTPLAAIQLKSELLDDLLEDTGASFDRKSASEMVLSIRQLTARIATIVNGLRAFSREAEGDPMTRTSLLEIVTDTLTLCHEKFRSHEITVEVLGLQEQATILCRSTQICQALLNLLNNSFDAISTAPGRRWIRIELESEETRLRLSLVDSGPGIPPAVHEKLFRPFFTTKGVGKGIGLGLSMARGIVEMHQGSLALDPSCPNTRFIMTFPKAQAT